MRKILAPVMWAGRVMLWILLPPLGLWRSVRHGRKASERRQAKLIGRELRKRD